MSIFASLRRQSTPITPEGYPFIAAFAFVSAVLFWLWMPLGWVGVVVTLWCVYFFRDPPRVTPLRQGLVIAPADGRISQIITVAPPSELGLGESPMLRISIFMSVFDCHINRSPAAGRVEKIIYRPGKFFNADLDKASLDNERNSLVISTAGTTIAVVQIAGLIARRIVCFVRMGQSVLAGERFGMIRFGSRLDVFLPEGTPPLVTIGQTAVGGETVLADLNTNDGARAYRSS
jgi:phosphatidylserine decarboxylase